MPVIGNRRGYFLEHGIDDRDVDVHGPLEVSHRVLQFRAAQPSARETS
jgi:hypothetical protein